MAVGYRGGLITGKIGGDVGYMVKNAKGRVSQGWRAYQAHVSNPNNYAQRYNRVILSTMARAYSVLRPICDHSFEGVSGASRNQKEFAKVNMPVLQGLASSNTGNFNLQGTFAGLINPLIISKGSLPPLEVIKGSVGDVQLILTLPSILQGDESDATLGDFFDVMGWSDSGQLTLCWTEQDDSPEIVRFRYARYVFKLGEAYAHGTAGDIATRDTPLFSVSGSGDETRNYLHYNVAESVGVSSIKVVPALNTDGLLTGFQFGNLLSDSANFQIGAVGAINSSLVGNSWKRSTQALDVNDTGTAGYEISNAIASYASTKDSSQYLNH